MEEVAIQFHLAVVATLSLLSIKLCLKLAENDVRRAS